MLRGIKSLDLQPFGCRLLFLDYVVAPWILELGYFASLCFGYCAAKNILVFFGRVG